MKYTTSKRFFAASMALTMLAMSTPALAGTTKINAFKFVRTEAVADGAQYFMFNFDVSSPGTNVTVDNGISAPITIASSLPGTMQQAGTLKVNAFNATMFPITDTTLNGNVINMKLTANTGIESAVVPLYVYKGIKFNSDIKLVSSAGGDADAGESLVVKQGQGQTITPTFSYDESTDFFKKAIDTFIKVGNKEILVTSGTATTVDSLPAGVHSAYFRGYNYAKADKSKKYGASGKTSIKLTVLAKPTLANVSVSGTATKDAKKPLNCINSGYGIGNDKIVLKFDAANITSAKIAVGTKIFEIKGGNGKGKIYNLDADCLTGTGVFAVKATPQNTGDYIGDASASFNVTVN